MRIWGHRISKQSIRYIILRFILIFGAFFTTALIYNNFYAIKVVRNQVAESDKSLVSGYMDLIDDRLHIAELYLSNTLAFNTDIVFLQSHNEVEHELANQQIKEKLTEDILMFQPIDCLYVYNKDTSDYIASFNTDENYDDLNTIDTYLREMLSSSADNDVTQNNCWTIVKVGIQYYMLRTVSVGNIYVGACTNVNKLLTSLKSFDGGDRGALLYLDSKGYPTGNADLIRKNRIDLSKGFDKYYMSGTKSKYLVIGVHSTEGNFSLVALVPDKVILEKLPYMQIAIYLIVLSLLIFLPISYQYLYRSVVYPLKKLSGAMEKIHNGDIDSRIAPFRTAEEYQILNNTFNKMMDQIQQLKISVYEEQMNKQRAELKRLQTEINPHFFMNSLNIIFSLAQTKDFELIEEMTICLRKYFHFIFQSNRTFVTLGEELEHVRNYIRIQEVRYPEIFRYAIRVDDSLLNILIPPCLIQTFAENTIKHSLNLDSSLFFSVVITPIVYHNESAIKITITDTGQHFPEEILEKIRNGEKIVDGRGEHTGIRNIQDRLRLLYSERASLTISNREPSGNRIEVVVPVQPDYLEAGN